VSVQNETNDRVYSSPRRVSEYVARRLTTVEQAVLAELEPAIAGRRVLEIGCGAGAITRELVALTDALVGIDISPAMVEYCTALLPRGTFAVGDVRDLSDHGSAAYDVVVAAANVIDVVRHDERPRVVAELRRVLADGGLLYISTHNRNSTMALDQARRGPKLAIAKNPYHQLRAVASFAQSSFNRLRLARYQVFEAEFAIINDSAHRWSLLHHYITRSAEENELAQAGFDVVSVRAADGRVLRADDDDTSTTELHFVARAV